MRIFGQLLLTQKQKASNLCKTTSKEFQFWNKSYATAVAMATMTFSYAGYFGFKYRFLHAEYEFTCCHAYKPAVFCILRSNIIIFY
jgi:hypothetical protein